MEPTPTYVILPATLMDICGRWITSMFYLNTITTI